MLLAFIVAAIFDVIAGSLGGPDPGNGFGTAIMDGKSGRFFAAGRSPSSNACVVFQPERSDETGDRTTGRRTA